VAIATWALVASKLEALKQEQQLPCAASLLLPFLSLFKNLLGLFILLLLLLSLHIASLFINPILLVLFLLLLCL